MAKRRRRKRSSTTKRRRRRRNPGALLVNPRKRYRRRRSRRRRSNPGALLVNPRRRRRSVRRNAGGIGAELLTVLLPAGVGGALFGYIDAKFLGKMGPVLRTAIKILGAFAVGYGAKRFTRAGSPVGRSLVAGVIGSIGSGWGIRAGGGIVASTKEEGAGALIAAARNNPYVARQLGALLKGPTRSAATMYAGELMDNEAAHYTDPDDDESEASILSEYMTGMANGAPAGP